MLKDNVYFFLFQDVISAMGMPYTLLIKPDSLPENISIYFL